MLTAILIDDEESSLNSLKQKILQHCPEIEIIASCNYPGSGMETIEALHPDLVFLDIEMPLMNGFTLLQHLKYKNFELIFVTAYDHYAIKAIRYSALDYLVKPIEIDSLKEAIKRAVSKKENLPNQRLELLLENASNEKKKYKKISIPTLEGLYFIKVDDIVYLEASGNYTKFHMVNNTKHTVSKTLKDFEEMLPPDVFIRIHNSYIINKEFVEKYIRGEGGQVVLFGNTVLDISKRKKGDFLRAIGN
jgi:two-component system LytT family response regulator